MERGKEIERERESKKQEREKVGGKKGHTVHRR